MPAKPREFERAIDGLGTAVGEENALQAGPFGKFSRQRTLKFIMKKIGKMNGTHGLAANGFDDARMGVAECVDRNTAEKIEILLPGGVEDIGAAATRKNDRRAFVSR